MSSYHEPRAGSIAMGTFCACLAGLVLVESAWRTGPTIDHVLSIGALVITIAAGEMMLKQLRGWHIIRAFGLLFVFLGGVTYTMVGTAGRTAEQQQQAQAKAESHADTRMRLTTERTRVVNLRDEAEAMLKSVQGKHQKECASGDGKNCRGLQKSIEVYEGTIKGRKADLADIDRQLSELGGEVPANGKLVAAAAAIEAFTSYPATEMLKRLTVAWPYVLPLMLEIGSIVFWTIGLGYRPQPAPKQAAVTVTPAAVIGRPRPTPPTGNGKRGRKLNPNVLSFQAAYRARHGKGPTAEMLMRKFPELGRSTAYDYVKRSA